MKKIEAVMTNKATGERLHALILYAAIALWLLGCGVWHDMHKPHAPLLEPPHVIEPGA